MKGKSLRITPAQRQVLGERLARRAAVLRAEISEGLHSGGLEEEARELVTAGIQADVIVASAERDAGELCEIEAALERMEADTYGLCADCGSPLSWARLDAIPEAPCCVRCERAREGSEPAPARL
jgi:RNA polymerase-binding transcription factor DksA